MDYTGTDVLEVMQEAKNYNQYLLDIIESSLGGQKILDFGAGIGQFAQPLREKGYQIYCLEPDSGQASRLREQGFTVFTDLSQLTEKFDTIYSINVLEHIKNDKEILLQLTNHLSDDGQILLYVPAFSVLYSEFDRRIGHLRRYSKSTLKPLVTNLKTLDFRYVDSIGFFAALFYKLTADQKGSLSPKAVHFYDRYLFPLSRWLDKLFQSSFGKNLLYVGKKQN